MPDLSILPSMPIVGHSVGWRVFSKSRIAADRMCCRTFGQRYLDSDVDIESVSVLMGHASTKTTEGFYSRKRLNKATDNARNSWLSSGGQ
ncbi:hypothetical protein [Methanomethylophilus alvi]|uniref:hypothetical protein n=1 Tax=Methanomethylophilus alvi TaxID=1291540 RepID=UPI0037DDB449